MTPSASFTLQFRLLLWKNFTLRKRKPFFLVLEIVAPVLIIFLLTTIRIRDSVFGYPPCYFQPKPLPSSGTLPWLTSHICNLNNTCFEQETDYVIDNKIPDFQPFLNSLATLFTYDRLESLVESLFETENAASKVYRNTTFREALKIKLGNEDKLRDNLSSKNIDLSESAWQEFLNLTLNYTISINRLVSVSSEDRCNKTQFQALFNINEWDRIKFLQSHFCNSTTEKLKELRETIDSNFNRYDYFITTNSTNENLDFLEEFEVLGNLFLNTLNSFQIIFEEIEDIIPQESDSATDQIKTFSKILCGEGSDFVRRLNINATENETESNKKKRKKRSVKLDQTKGESILNRRKRTAVNQDQPFCRELIGQLNSKDFQYIYDYTGLNLFLEGAVYYTPDNNLTREIIKHANKTFGGIGKLVDAVMEWNERFSSVLYNELANGELTEFIREIVDSCRGEIGSGDICNRLYDWLDTSNTDGYNWVLSLYFVDQIINEIGKYLSCFNWNKFIPTDTEDIFNKMDDTDKLWAGIVFDNLPIDKKSSHSLKDISHMSVRIRMGTKYVDSTRGFTVFEPFWSPQPRRAPLFDMKYFNYGFIYLQDIIVKAILTSLNNGKELDYGIHMQQLPYPCYSIDEFNLIVARSLPLFMTVGWIFSVALSVRAIVYEKELRLKEYMRVMGLSNGIHWCSWLITTLTLMTISVIIITIFLKFGQILPNSDVTLIFFVLMAFVIATVSQAFFISVFFSKANIAATVSGIVYFVCYLPFNIVEFQEDSLTEPILYCMCLLSPVAFGLCTQYFARYESTGKGMQWNDITESTAVEDPFNLSKCLAMMCFDAFLFALLTWYIEGVFPGKYGVPKKWYFPFTKDYWCGQSVEMKDENFERNNIQQSTSNSEYFEDEPQGLNLGVAIHGLSKTYKNRKLNAVDNLSLNFYENQITSFLGHNGAGKTTTISILTGLYAPSKGTAYIYGRDIAQDMDAIRNNLGLCPQFNVLFDLLTVEEHIYFYGMLKGIKKENIENEISMVVKNVGLPHKRRDLSKTLSGGMKRKLSVAMAFVGDSKVVILDEPTAGVDPYARRSIWDLLVRCKKSRTIILTTHHMDEADALSDRIAVISNGKLKCCGTGIFLKSIFGTGYHLVLVKGNSNSRNDASVIQATDLVSFIQSRVPQAQLINETSTELVFKLPSYGLSDGSYHCLLTDLDSDKENLNIVSYGLSDTPLEEVFLTVADDPAGEAENLKIRERKDNDADIESIACKNGIPPRSVNRQSITPLSNSSAIKTSCIKNKNTCNNNFPNETIPPSVTQDSEKVDFCKGTGTYTVSGFRFVLIQFQAIWIKRFHNFKRNKRGFIAELIFPTLFILLACGAVTFSTNFSSYPSMELHPWLMKLNRIPNMNIFYSNSNISNSWTSKLVELVRTPLGAGGVRCMNSSIYAIDKYPCSVDYNNQTWSAGPNGSISQRSPDCICIKGKPQECNDYRSGGPDPAKKLLATTDYLYDLTGYNISDYLLKTHGIFEKSRFGGFKFTKLSRVSVPLFTDKEIYDFFNNRNYSEFLLKINAFARSLMEPDHRVTVYFKNKGFASSVAYLAVAQNLIMRSMIYNNSEEAYNKGISLFNHPLNLTYDNLLEDALLKTTISLVLAIFIIFALSFIPASFVLFLIDERATHSKHLQFVSGLNPYIYWMANYLWDLVNYLAVLVLIVIIFVAFQLEEFISQQFIGPFLLLMIGYGASVIPFLYPTCFIFKTSSTAFVIVSSVNFLIGLGTTLSVFLIQTLINDDIILERVFDFLSRAFLVFPQYCLGRGLINLSRLYITKKLDIFNEDAQPLEFEILGNNLLAFLCQIVVYFLLVLFIERNFFCGDRQCLKKTIVLPEITDEDDDVAAERKRVLSHEADEDAVRLVNLTKIYSGNKLKRPAVNQLCLGIKKGQCFGLLGVNGAGKTSTFMMLTGQENATKGDAYVADKSVRSELIEVHRNIGYCPQFDALNNLLTGRETLSLYARLRGIPSHEINWVVDWALNRLSLMPHADKPAGAYSGGNKRKLSTAIALIGNPDVIFLDEPTSGMDPGAKRFLWNCISEIVQEGRCVVLTTHSMEECEALCQRLCIMVNGNIKCLGSVQHLKSKFGEGYTVALKLKNSDMNTDAVKEFICKCFPQSILNEEHFARLEYKVDGTTKLVDLFKSLQEGKEKYRLYEDYSVSQTTLDQVFIDFAKFQSDMFNEEIVDMRNNELSDKKVKQNCVKVDCENVPTVSHNLENKKCSPYSETDGSGTSNDIINKFEDHSVHSFPDSSNIDSSAYVEERSTITTENFSTGYIYPEGIESLQHFTHF